MPSHAKLVATRQTRYKKLHAKETKAFESQLADQLERTLDREEFEQHRSELFAEIERLAEEIAQSKFGKRGVITQHVIRGLTNRVPLRCRFLFREAGYHQDRHPETTWPRPAGEHGKSWFLGADGRVYQGYEDSCPGSKGLDVVYSMNYTIHNTELQWCIDALNAL